MDRWAVTKPGVVKISRLASCLWRSARRGPQILKGFWSFTCYVTNMGHQSTRSKNLMLPGPQMTPSGALINILISKCYVTNIGHWGTWSQNNILPTRATEGPDPKTLCYQHGALKDLIQKCHVTTQGIIRPFRCLDVLRQIIEKVNSVRIAYRYFHS